MLILQYFSFVKSKSNQAGSLSSAIPPEVHLPDPRRQRNSSPGAGFSHMTLYTWNPRTAEDIEKLNIVMCFLVCSRT